MSLYDIWAEDHRCYADLVYDLVFKSKQMSQCRQLQPLPLLPQPPAQQPPLSFSQSTPSKNAAATAPALEQSRIQNRLAAVSDQFEYLMWADQVPSEYFHLQYHALSLTEQSLHAL